MNKINSKISLKELAGLVSNQLRSKHLQCVLVGGAVVSIYTKNDYQSLDLDFISPNDTKEITEAMNELGFKKVGKNYKHPNCQFTVEFPSGPVAIGNEIPVKPEGEVKTKSGKVILLSPTQCVMDRLAWFYHYNDRQCLDQAIMVAKSQPINLDKIRKWSTGEQSQEKYELFLSKLSLKNSSHQN